MSGCKGGLESPRDEISNYLDDKNQERSSMSSSWGYANDRKNKQTNIERLEIKSNTERRFQGLQVKSHLTSEE